MILNIPTVQGLTINGTLKGTRQKQGANGKTTTYVGIDTVTTDAYGQDVTETIECIISDKMLSSTPILPKLLSVVGTEVSLPVWGRPWKTERSEGISFYLTNKALELFK